MAAQQSYPTLNATAPSFADFQVDIALYDGPSVQTADIVALNWSRSVEVGEVRGLGGALRKRTRGSLSMEAAMTLTVEGYAILTRALKEVAAAKELPGLSLVTFDISGQWIVPGSDDVNSLVIRGCRITGDSNDNAEGSDASQVELTLSPMRIEFNGAVLL